MSFEQMLDHTCDIYHIQTQAASPGSGRAASPSFSYPEEPDIKEQPCHFGVKARAVTITQTAPANLMDAKIKLTLPIGTDVRLNDKIVDCATHLEYTAEQPVPIRGHHLIAYIKMVGGQKPL